MRLLVSGGGTGGHVYPILSVTSQSAAVRPRPAEAREERLPRQANRQSELQDSAQGLAPHEPPAEAASSLHEGRALERLAPAQPDLSQPLQSRNVQRPDPAQPDSPLQRPEGEGRAQPRVSPLGQETETLPAEREQKAEREAEWCEPDGAVDLLYVGQAGGIEEQLAARAGIPFAAVDTGPILGRTPWMIVRNLMRMQRGSSQCAKIIREFRPDVVFLTGGYVSAPVAWAAWRSRPRVPVLIYLPDLTPGWSIRLTSRIADRVAVSFPEVSRYFGGKAVVTGYPVRAEFFTTPRAQALSALGLTDELPVVLVFGGSRGAYSINKAIADALPELVQRCQVVHLSGPHDWQWVSGLAAALPPDRRSRYHPFEYLHDEMISALAAANLVVARAGASVLGEFPALGLPSILVPYPYAGQHQDANAAYLADRGAAIVIRDSELGGELSRTVERLLDSPEQLGRMAAAALDLARPHAASCIMDQLRDLAHLHNNRIESLT